MFVGVINWFVACELYFYLLNRGAVHMILPIANSHPVFGVLVSVLLLGEEPTLLIFVSVAFVALGAYFLAPRRKERDGWKDMLLAFTVAIMWGSMIAPMKYCLNEGVTAGTFLAIVVTSAAVACNIAMGVSHVKFDKEGVGLSILSGLIGFFIGELLFLLALEIEKASVIAPVCGAVIPFGFLLSTLLVGERPSKRAILGMAIVFLGVLLATV
jgi:drug/metabolite transporter (DMT)-like permease